MMRPLVAVVLAAAAARALATPPSLPQCTLQDPGRYAQEALNDEVVALWLREGGSVVKSGTDCHGSVVTVSLLLKSPPWLVKRRVPTVFVVLLYPADRPEAAAARGFWRNLDALLDRASRLRQVKAFQRAVGIAEIDPRLGVATPMTLSGGPVHPRLTIRFLSHTADQQFRLREPQDSLSFEVRDTGFRIDSLQVRALALLLRLRDLLPGGNEEALACARGARFAEVGVFWPSDTLFVSDDSKCPQCGHTRKCHVRGFEQ
jgi:hypothetical protein